MNEITDEKLFKIQDALLDFKQGNNTFDESIIIIKKLIEDEYQSGRDAQRESDAEIALYPSSDEDVYEMIKINTGDIK